jgi:threonine synthase
VEPASAAAVAGLLRCVSNDRCSQCPLTEIEPGSDIVLTLTGHGLKDVAALAQGEPIAMRADAGAVLAAL